MIDQEKGLTSAEWGGTKAKTARFEQMCVELAAYGIPESLNHGDFHDGNILLKNGRITFFDWGDATVTHGALEVNLQYLRREDDDPRFNAGGAVVSEGGFAEVLVRPAGRKWHLFGLYNLVTADAPLLDVRLGGPAGLERYESVTAGLGYLVRRNFKVSAEATRDVEAEATRWSVGFVTAF